MPIPERHYKEIIRKHEEAERVARRDTLREWLRVLGEIVLWSGLGLVGIGLAFNAVDADIGWIYWWAGALLWVAGVSVAVISAYLRGVKRGDWK